MPNMLLTSAILACGHALDRGPRCLIIIKQGSQRRLHSEHGGARDGSVKRPSTDDDCWILAKEAIKRHSGAAWAPVEGTELPVGNVAMEKAALYRPSNVDRLFGWGAGYYILVY